MCITVSRPKQRRPCIDCGQRLSIAGLARCSTCQHGKNQEHNDRRAALAPSTGAAASVRRELNKAGVGTCQNCRALYSAKMLEVDHIEELVDGGLDVLDNIQVLCKQHHRAKTTDAARSRRVRDNHLGD